MNKLWNTEHLLFIKLNCSLSFHSIGLVISRSALLISEFTCSFSSMWLRSRPLAWAIRFPATRFPTITEAGPTSAKKNMKYLLSVFYVTQTQCSITHTKACVPGCFCLGLGRLVMQEWGHMRMLQGCRAPSRNICLVSDRWIPPRGVLGRVLAGTNARQYTPTWWIPSIA